MDRISLPDQIESRRITLKRHVPELAEEMFQCVEQERERLRVFLPWVDSMRTVNDERVYIQACDRKWKACESFDYGIYLRNPEGVTESPKYLGGIGVPVISWDDERCEIGYWIRSDHEGQGLVSEAVKALEYVLFMSGFHRIEIRCSSKNERSAHVPKARAYHFEGALRDHSKENGEFSHTLIFSKLRTEVFGR